METQSSGYKKINNQEDNPSFSWFILSVISWILFICTIWFCYLKQNNEEFPLFIFGSIINKPMCKYFYIRINIPWFSLYICLISFLGFGVYIVFTTFKRNQRFYDSMMGGWSKFHFIPLLFITALNIISYNAYISPSLKEEYKYDKMLLIFDMIFTLISLISLIIIYLKMELNCEWYFSFLIKKGVFSTFIIVLWYNFFCVILYLKTIDSYLDDEADSENLYSFFKGMYIAFSFAIGIVSLLFSFFFKDIIAAFVTFLLYLGFVIDFFTKNRDQSYKEARSEYFSGSLVGIIDIIMMCLSFIFIVFLLIIFNKIGF